jgi:hypothetical protein
MLLDYSVTSAGLANENSASTERDQHAWLPYISAQ